MRLLPGGVTPCFSQLGSSRPSGLLLTSPSLKASPGQLQTAGLPHTHFFPPSPGHHQRLFYFIVLVTSIPQQMSVSSMRMRTASVLFTAAFLVPSTGSGTQAVALSTSTVLCPHHHYPSSKPFYHPEGPCTHAP